MNKFSFIKSLLALLLLVVASTNAFSVRPVTTVSRSLVAPSSTSLNVFGNRKSAAQKAAAAAAEKFWQGEWVCKDCGYIYSRVGCSFNTSGWFNHRPPDRLVFGVFAGRVCWHVL